ncbi:MAG: CHRD domain-containing protein [Bacteroidia bacterium]|nr:CHRD domain-containing protein [Bacteroidia bacterium]
MRIIAVILGLIFGLGWSTQSYAVDKITLSAKIDGQSQVPANSSLAKGVGYIAVSEDMSSIRIRLTAGGLSSNITSIDIREGAAGINGAVLITLSSRKTQDTVIVVNKAMLGKLLSGNAYFNVHTTNNPNGEIRGQIYVEQDYIFTAELSGAKQMPPVTTNAKGVAIILIPRALNKVYIWATTSGLTGTITSCHLHKAPDGQSGGVILDLTAIKSERHIFGNVAIVPTITLADLIAGNIYLNIHTAANSSGEIRGNFNWIKGLHFDTFMNGASVMPAATTDAVGLTTLWTSPNLDTLYYRMLAVGDKLTSEITSARICNGIVGSNGTTVHSMNTNTIGDVSGFWKASDAAPFDLTNLQKFLKNEMYVQVNTTLNASGEIRGQCRPNARNGYLINIDAQQAGSTTTGSGTGIASINRYENHLTYLIAIEGLTASIQSAHFHNAARGSSGTSVYDITNSFGQIDTYDLAAGAWNSTDAVPFTPAQLLNLKNGNLYVDVHTQANPNGELRGQVDSPVIQTGIEELKLASLLSVYPNPCSNLLNFNIENDFDNYQVTIKTIQGATVLDENRPLSGTLDIHNLPAGMLILNILDKNGNLVYVSKLVKL